MGNTLEIRYWHDSSGHGIEVRRGEVNIIQIVGHGRDSWASASPAEVKNSRRAYYAFYALRRVFGNPNKWSQTPWIERPVWDATWYRAPGELEIIQHIIQQVELHPWVAGIAD